MPFLPCGCWYSQTGEVFCWRHSRLAEAMQEAENGSDYSADGAERQDGREED